MNRRRKKFGFVVGPSGIGKEFGVGSVIREYFGVELFVSGDWCREHHREHSSRGILVNDELIRAAAEEHYVNIGCPDYFMFDCPRSPIQAHSFMDMYHRWDPAAEIVTLHISASPQVCTDRIKHRAEQKGRIDDGCDKAIQTRLAVYFGPGGIKETVIPILESKTNYRPIDGHEPLENIRTQVRAVHGPAIFG